MRPSDGRATFSMVGCRSVRYARYGLGQ